MPTLLLQPGIMALNHTLTNRLQPTTNGMPHNTMMLQLYTTSQPMTSMDQVVTSKSFMSFVLKIICKKLSTEHFRFSWMRIFLMMICFSFDRYPAGVNPAACPNYPYCDTGAHGSYHVQQVAPLPGYTSRQYPAGINAASCPNYPYCA